MQDGGCGSAGAGMASRLRCRQALDMPLHLQARRRRQLLQQAVQALQRWNRVRQRQALREDVAQAAHRLAQLRQ